MKRRLLLLTIILAFVLVGCGNKEYDEAMENGKLAIEEVKYDDAVAFFETALEAKVDDEAASDYLLQTESMITGLDTFDKGDLDKATDAFKKVGMVEDASTLLQDEAKEQLSEIEALVELHATVEDLFKEAEKVGAENKFEDATAVIDEALKHDFDHVYMEDLEANLQTLQTDLEKAEEKAVAEAKKKAEEKKQKEAEEKRKAEEEKKLAEEKAQAEKDQQQVNKVVGYWLTMDETMACHITESYMACAVAYSDVMFNDPISSIKGNPGEDSVTFTFGNGTTSTVSTATDGVLHMGETINRVSKEQANGIYDGYYELP